MVQVLHRYKSRCNIAELIELNGKILVRKKHHREETFLREQKVYQMLHGQQLPCAQMLSVEGTTIFMTKLPGSNLVTVLEKQESEGVWNPVVWAKLVDWLVTFRDLTGLSMTDVNLRNFLYDENTQTVYGLDFEDCGEDSLLFSAGRLAAFIRTYNPENTRIKQEISQFVLHRFSQQLGVDLQTLFRESKRQETLLLMRRRR